MSVSREAPCNISKQLNPRDLSALALYVEQNSAAGTIVLCQLQTCLAGCVYGHSCCVVSSHVDLLLSEDGLYVW